MEEGRAEREREREKSIKKIWPMMIVLEKERGMRRRKEQQEKVVERKEKRWHYLSHNFAKKVISSITRQPKRVKLVHKKSYLR